MRVLNNEPIRSAPLSSASIWYSTQRAALAVSCGWMEIESGVWPCLMNEDQLIQTIFSSAGARDIVFRYQLRTPEHTSRRVSVCVSCVPSRACVWGWCHLTMGDYGKMSGHFWLPTPLHARGPGLINCDTNLHSISRRRATMAIQSGVMKKSRIPTRTKAQTHSDLWGFNCFPKHWCSSRIFTHANRPPRRASSVRRGRTIIIIHAHAFLRHTIIPSDYTQFFPRGMFSHYSKIQIPKLFHKQKNT